MLDANTELCISELRKAGCTVTLIGAPLNGTGEPTSIRILRPDPDVPDGIETELPIDKFKLIALRTVLELQEKGELI